jgi:hypothetical protein
MCPNVIFRFIGSVKVVGSNIPLRVFEPLCLNQIIENKIAIGDVAKEDDEFVTIFGDVLSRNIVCEYAVLFSNTVLELEAKNFARAKQLETQLLSYGIQDEAIPILQRRLELCNSHCDDMDWDCSMIQVLK